MSLVIEPSAAPLREPPRVSGEPGWLADLRRAWWAHAVETPLPSGQEEEWRRTSLDKLPRDVPAAEPGDVHVTLDGLDPRDAGRGVVFVDLPRAAREYPDLLRRALGAPGERAGVASHAHFWSVARAAWPNGTLLHVPRGVAVEGVLRVSVEASRADAAILPLTLVLTEPESSVTLLEEVVSPDGTGWWGGGVEVLAGAGSRVRYAQLQTLGDGIWNLGSQLVEVGQDADVKTLNTEVGSGITKLGLEVRMLGKGGVSKLLGLLAAGRAQHIDINSLQDLYGSHSRSELLYLSALYERAKAAFYGLLRVRPEARSTSSYQECRNLLLSPDAGAEPIPALEIMTNDILRCGHGATAGAIDPNQLFYAQTRGLSAEEAERMIVRGFFEQVLSQIDSEPIKARMLEALAVRIGRTDELEEAA
jgi:Fe-S cluster assembly protein SufD